MTARSGMADLITQVRQLAACGTADYTVGAATYWTDDQVEDVLDRVRVEVYSEALRPTVQKDSGGTARYYEYRSAAGWYEQTTGGSAVWYLQDSTGAYIGTANYSVDYANGRVTFGVDQAGSVRYLTGRSYDVHAAAALVWESKAAHVAERFDFSADGASFKASQLMAQYNRMAQRMWAQSTTGGVQTHRMVRSDDNVTRY